MTAKKRTPDPELVAEAKRLIAELTPMLNRTIEGEGEKLRFTVTLPKEYAVLAAWLIFKADTEKDGKTVVLPRPVRLHLDDGRRARDWNRAKAYFNFVIGEALDAEWKKLQALMHPVLFQDDDAGGDPRRASPLQKPYSGHEVIDDDIPF